MAAIYQKRLKRLLAYSSIGQLGLICLALSSYSIFTVKLASVYLLLYLVMAILSFTIIILVTTKDLIPKFLIN
jgi:NADH:ubiquinone oxidoreductase subunit 2 (subunit N)